MGRQMKSGPVLGYLHQSFDWQQAISKKPAIWQVNSNIDNTGYEKVNMN